MQHDLPCVHTGAVVCSHIRFPRHSFWLDPSVANPFMQLYVTTVPEGYVGPTGEGDAPFNDIWGRLVHTVVKIKYKFIGICLLVVKHFHCFVQAYVGLLNVKKKSCYMTLLW